MHDVHLRDLDLNLLVVLRALIAERSVTRAAAEVGLSQPAMSHALARLRTALGDQLLVRTPRGMEPTPRAKAIAEPLERALANLREAVNAPTAFDPKRARRGFRIATDDYLELVLMPQLLARLWLEAPGINVRILNSSGRSGHDLAEGRIDLIIDPVSAFGPLPGAYSQRIIEERFVCVVRADHPRVRKRLTLDTFVALPQALVAPGGRPGSIVDAALAKRGLRRRVALEIPHFLAAPHIVRHTDVILTIGERIAQAMADGLRILAPPIELPRFTVETIWHERHHADPAHTWFRHVVAEVAKEL
jgi:DNA-binding transcriptional LysR family regulator